MKPPKSIRICGHDINLKFETNDDYHGLYIPSKMEIQLDTKLKGRMIADIILHEIMHGIYHLAPVYPKDKEERTVSALATHTMTVFAENKDFADWWYSLIHPDTP